MTVRAHLAELRNRLIIVALVFAASFGVAYAARDIVQSVLLAPLEGKELSFLSVGGGFTFEFAVTLWCGIAVALPFLLLTVYGFMSPAISSKARRNAPLVFMLSLVLLVSGALFGYFYAIPGAIRFLLGFAGDQINAMVTTDSYLSFVLVYTVGLGMLFQLPLLLMIINWIKPLRPSKLLSFERYVIVASFIMAAIITPTVDVMNQIVIALPVIAMYQVGVGIVIFSNWREHKKRASRAKRANKLALAPESSTIPDLEEPAINQAKPTIRSERPHSAAVAPVQPDAPRPVKGLQTRSRVTDIGGLGVVGRSAVTYRQSLSVADGRQRQPDRPVVPSRPQRIQSGGQIRRTIDGLSPIM